MRPLVVEALDEGIEAGLLLQDIGGGRLGRFGLQRQMHALVAAVLLGMARARCVRAECPGVATTPTSLLSP